MAEDRPLDRTEFVALMTRLRACYPQALGDVGQWAAVVSTYWVVVSTYDPADVRRAMSTAWRHYDAWFPTLGQLVRLIEDRGSTPALRAAEAWPEVLRIAAGSGETHRDPIAVEAIRLMGGARALGQWKSDDLERFGRGRFISTYLELCDQRSRSPSAPALPTPDPRLARLAGEVAQRRAMPTDDD